MNYPDGMTLRQIREMEGNDEHGNEPEESPLETLLTVEAKLTAMRDHIKGIARLEAGFHNRNMQAVISMFDDLDAYVDQSLADQ